MYFLRNSALLILAIIVGGSFSYSVVWGIKKVNPVVGPVINNITDKTFSFFKSNTEVAGNWLGDLFSKDGPEILRAQGGSSSLSVEDSVTSDNSVANYYLKNDKKLPSISAKEYLVADLDTGDILFSLNASHPRPIASVSKLMTAVIAIETIDQEAVLKIPYRAVMTYGNQGNLKTGQKFSVNDMLYPLLIESSNDAAEAIAEYVGRSFFLVNMNGKADSIGMNSTEYIDPSGLSEKNISTANDLFNLIKYIWFTEPQIINISRIDKIKGSTGVTWSTTSDFIDDPRYRGGKNGYTDEAQDTLVAVFSLPISEGINRNIVVILLGSSAPTRDVSRILTYTESNFDFVGESAADIDLSVGTSSTAISTEDIQK